MNAFALLSLLSAAVVYTLGVLLYYQNRKNIVNKLFFFFSLVAGYQSFTQFEWRQADAIQTAYLWMKVGAFWWVFMSLVLHFTLVFTEQSRLLKLRLTYLVIYVPGVAISLLDLTTDLLLGEPVKAFWGWTHGTPQTSLYKVAMTWVAGVSIGYTYLLLRHYLKATETPKKRRAKYMLAGLSIPAILGFATEGLFPALGIRVPELASTGYVLGGTFVAYAVWKYQPFTLSLAIVPEKVVSTMSDPLLLVSPEGRIAAVNQATLKLLGYERDELVHQAMETVFAEGEYENGALKDTRLAELISTGFVSDIETTFKTKAGSKIPVSLSASIIRARDGEQMGVVYIGRDLTERKRAEEAFVQRAIALARTEELQRSRLRIIAAQEGLRRDIATHLHGRVQGRLLALKGRLQELVGGASASSEVAEPLREVVDHMDQVVQQELSVLSRRLYPSILRRGLVPALQSLGDQLEAALAVEMELDEELMQRERANPNLIPERVRLAAYRIAEEALTNVVKHAKATRITVRLDLSSDGRLRLTVGDNGQGFDVEGVPGGLGMAVMQDYAEAASGWCIIDSAPGKGTEVTATIPLAGPGAGSPKRSSP